MNSLATRIGRWARTCGETPTPLPRLKFFRQEAPQDPSSYLQPPSLCLVVQGAKRVFFGTGAYDYGTGQLALTTLDLPLVADVTLASPQQPYLSRTLTLDPELVSQVLMRETVPWEPVAPPETSLVVSEASPTLLDAIGRLVDLLDDPETLGSLAPLVEQEILFRLLKSPQGDSLRQIGLVGGPNHRIGRAVAWLKENFAQPLYMKELASLSAMSLSTFHQHFRTLTAMTPLQYQKWLRLQEARRLMLTEDLDAADAGFRVGYESPSQFSRDYARLFQAPPHRDIRALRGA